MMEGNTHPLAWAILRRLKAGYQRFLTVMFLAVGLATPALAATAGGKNDPTEIIKNGVCGTNGSGLLGFVTNPLFVGVALAAGVAVWGWNQYFGQMDSTVALKRGFIGMVAVLCCATIAGFFIGGC